MSPPVGQGRLPVEQAVDRFRARVVAELRTLNEHLPRSARLERAEIDRLVDSLLFAVREVPKRRKASLLDKTVWMAGGMLVRAIRRRRKASGTAPGSRRQPVDESVQHQGDAAAHAAPRTAPEARDAHLRDAPLQTG